MKYASEYLVKKGYSLCNSLEKADFAVLPIPVKPYMLEKLSGKYVFYGAGDARGFDYNKVESFLLENAYLTAEGAVALLKENTGKAIYGSRVLITGYGRIASALHNVFSAMGANVTVCCRSHSDKIKAKYAGAGVIDFPSLKENGDYDYIFNTVPHIVFTKDELEALKDGALLFDLASFPGGVDTLFAKSKKISVIDGKRLPLRFSKIAAGELIGKTIDKIIKEELS